MTFGQSWFGVWTVLVFCCRKVTSVQHKYVVGSVIICRVLKGVALLVFLCLHCIVRICAIRILLVWKGVLFLSDCLPIFIPTCVGVSVLKLSHNGWCQNQALKCSGILLLWRKIAHIYSPKYIDGTTQYTTPKHFTCISKRQSEYLTYNWWS